ncbi:MAG TPA: hypothetical protein DCF68_13775 [Cyanothece sp. UBA12306]|nr:hypothetical protein [Cyanothece sp. UBA12306]
MIILYDVNSIKFAHPTKLIYANINKRNEVINNNKNSQLVAQQISENKYFVGTLQGCNRSGSTVRCAVVFRSKQDLRDEVECKYGNVTRLFDRFGNTYLCSEVQIGNQKREGSLTSRYPQRTPVKVTLTFKNIPSQTNEFDTLEVHTDDYGFLRFRNIKVSG